MGCDLSAPLSDIVSPNASAFHEHSLKGVAEYIQRRNPKILWLSGAGISVSCGIPDFRSPKTGLYQQLAKYKLPYPEAIFDMEYFGTNPTPFYTLAKTMYPGNHSPSKTHFFIKLLQNKNLLLRNWTQNIDGLERLVGVRPDLLVEAHGTFASAHCTGCSKRCDRAQVRKSIMSGNQPLCSECGSLQKPGIIFFGENIRSNFDKKGIRDCGGCSLLIVAGSSLAVQPFARLVDMVGRDCPRVVINMNPANSCGEFEDGKGFKFHSKGRDLFLQGDCDQTILKLCKLLGWERDLAALTGAYNSTVFRENLLKDFGISSNKSPLPTRRASSSSTNVPGRRPSAGNNGRKNSHGGHTKQRTARAKGESTNGQRKSRSRS